MSRAAVLVALVLPALALAQDRPNEESMFGEAAPEADAGVAPDAGLTEVAAPFVSDGGRDDSELGGKALKNQFDTGDAKADPLKIGGTLYLRGQTTWLLDQPFEKSSFAAPGLLDVFMDARPSDRVRGFVLGRLRYDPTLSSTAASSLIPNVTGATTSNPSVSLDQLWLRFDIAQKVFVTVGRQKVKWGTARIWNPTDFLNAQKRDPLAPFDLRLGINALKVHVPVESLGWNFTAYGLLDNNGPASLLGQLGGAARAEFLLGPAELGLDAAWVKGRRPRYGVDLSTPLGPVDVYGEVAFRDGRDFTIYREHTEADPPVVNPEDAFPVVPVTGIQIQASGGASLSLNYTDANVLTLGVEYFYNPAGASKPILYLPAIYGGTFTPFYAGQHYVGFSAVTSGLPSLPWITLSFANLVNLSDPSGTARFDAFFLAFAYLRIEAFVSVNYGAKGGEFRFGANLPEVTLGSGQVIPAFVIPYPVASCGVGLRVSI